MAVSELRLIKNCMEFVHQDDVNNVPPKTRGLYVLFKYRPRLNKYDVVYIGMAGGEKKQALTAGFVRISRKKQISGLISPLLRSGTISEKTKFENWKEYYVIFSERTPTPTNLVFKSPLKNSPGSVKIQNQKAG